MKKQFIFIVEKKIEKNKKNFLQSVFDTKKTIPKKSSFVILDLSKFYYGKDFNLVNKLKKKFNFIKVNNEQELEDVLSNKKNYCFPRLKNDFRMIRILRLIKKFKIKIISSTTEGLYPQSYYKGDISLSFKLLSLFKYKLNYFFFRVFAALDILPSIDYYFESSQSRINYIKKRRKKNILYFFFGKKSYYYRKIIRVNSSILNVAEKFKTKIDDRYVVFVDSGYEHPDVTKKEIRISNKKRAQYYENLFNFLDNIQRELNTKIMYCKHPRGIYPENFNKFYKNFNVSVGKVEYYIAKSKIVFFYVSTLMNLAILMNKNLVLLESDQDYGLYKDKFYSIKKEINLYSLNISKKNLNFKKKITKIKKKKLLYKKFIRSNHIIDQKKSYFQSMRDRLNNL
tara:strand:+ start:1349 stop:2539 length:1191 start_codon:yes stop_codon:yes gene_type:complete